MPEMFHTFNTWLNIWFSGDSVCCCIVVDIDVDVVACCSVMVASTYENFLIFALNTLRSSSGTSKRTGSLTILYIFSCLTILGHNRLWLCPSKGILFCFLQKKTAITQKYYLSQMTATITVWIIHHYQTAQIIINEQYGHYNLPCKY